MKYTVTFQVEITVEADEPGDAKCKARVALNTIEHNNIVELYSEAYYMEDENGKEIEI